MTSYVVKWDSRVDRFDYEIDARLFASRVMEDGYIAKKLEVIEIEGDKSEVIAWVKRVSQIKLEIKYNRGE